MLIHCSFEGVYATVIYKRTRQDCDDNDYDWDLNHK